jgi:DNA topoisomerase VI subunit B
VATKRVNWSSYLVDIKKESVGVFVSIVSTRIPFKGTSKEYIGDDVVEIQQSVRRAILGCA